MLILRDFAKSQGPLNLCPNQTFSPYHAMKTNNNLGIAGTLPLTQLSIQSSIHSFLHSFIHLPDVYFELAGLSSENKEMGNKYKNKSERSTQLLPSPQEWLLSLCSTKCFIYIVKFNSHSKAKQIELPNSNWDFPNQTNLKCNDVLKVQTSLNLVLNTMECLCFCCCSTVWYCFPCAHGSQTSILILLFQVTEQVQGPCKSQFIWRNLRYPCRFS